MNNLTFSPELVTKDITQAKNDFKGVTSFRKRLKMLHKWRPQGVIGLQIHNLKKDFLKRTPKTAVLQPIKIKRDCITDLVLLTNKPKKSIERGLATFFKKYYLLQNISNYSREWLIFGPEGCNLEECFESIGAKTKIKSKSKIKIKTKIRAKTKKRPIQTKNRKKHKRQIKKFRTDTQSKTTGRNKRKSNTKFVTSSSKQNLFKNKLKHKTKIKKKKKLQLKNQKQQQQQQQKQQQKQKQNTNTKRNDQIQIQDNKHKFPFRSIDKTKFNWFPLDSFVNSDNSNFSDFHNFFNGNSEKTKTNSLSSIKNKKKNFTNSVDNVYLSNSLKRNHFEKDFDLEEEFADFEDFEFDNGDEEFEQFEDEEENEFDKETTKNDNCEDGDEYFSTPKVKKSCLITKQRSPNPRKRLFQENDKFFLDRSRSRSRSPMTSQAKSFKKRQLVSNPKKILRNTLQVQEFSDYEEEEENVKENEKETKKDTEMDSPISYLSSPNSSFSFSFSSDLESDHDSDNDLFEEKHQIKQAQLVHAKKELDNKGEEDQREEGVGHEFWDLSSTPMDMPGHDWFKYTNHLPTYEGSNYQPDIDFDIISGFN
ncbi:phd zinc finger-containing protein-related [Anaeramoeba flamelloides]|uniref:Phd zinc finger-containing protein-related n=1 Tax=Anaeramoeba flamelloides TaxID=1746091 RepID=A0ABQ8Z0P7_9EUKA|nr:phd zinc finger-containing protein-related [Anaeramoeba flamelloides]